MRQKINVALIGIGNFGQKLADTIKKTENLNLRACFHEKIEKAEEFALKNGCKAFSDTEEMFKENFEAVIIATPNHLHGKYAMLAIEKNKHLFIEKPIANGINEAEQILNEAERKNIIVMVGHNARRNTAIRKIKEMIDNGKMGKLVSAEINMSHGGGMKFTSDNWRFHKNNCPGGPLIMLGSHAADISNYLFGPAKSVCAAVKNLYAPTEAEDTSMVVLELKMGGLVYLANNYNTPTTYYIRIFGTNGILEYNKNLDTLSFQGPDNGREPASLQKMEFLKNDTILEELKEFGECVLDGKKPETSGKEGLEALKIINAALLSAREQKTVSI
jgi:UDP-N-acetylglucosamine 3-dehydrogenase